MNASSNPRGPVGRPWLPVFAGALVVLIGVVAYWNSLGVPFLFDDAPAIERNQTIHQLWPLSTVLAPPQTAAGATGRPIVNLSLALNYAAGGLDPRGYHAVNLVLHALAALALFGLIRRTLLLPTMHGRWGTSALPFALATAALWVAHPLLTESVVCVVQRNELLVSLFFLLTLYSFARAVTASAPGRWQVAAFVSCLLGMASKEVMATAPLLVFLYDRTFVAGTFGEAWRRRWRFHLALASTWILLAVLVAQHHQRAGIVGFGLGVSAWEYLLTQCRALVIYLKLAVWPHPLVLDYGVETVKDPSEVWWQGLLILILLGATVTALWRRPVVGFLGAWFFVILAPSSSFLPLTTQPIAEHRMYLPLAAVLVAVVAGIRALPGRSGARFGAALVMGSAWLTIERIDDYRDEATIWTDTIAQQPGNARAYASLGNVLARQQRWEEAIHQYEEAVRLRPDYADAQSDLASVLLKAGRASEALSHLELALALKPGDNDIQYNFAVALAQANRFTDAIENLEAVLRRQPKRAEAWNNLGDALLKTGRRAEAIQAFEQALRIDPDSAAAHNNVGVALAALGHWSEAIAHYEAATRLAPGNLEVRNNHGDALLQAGRPADAAAEYQAALRLNPGLAGLHYNLANVWMQLARLEDAVREFEEALRLAPDFPAAHHNLGLALTRMGRAGDAVPHFEATLRALPNSAPAHHNLAVALAQLGRFDEAMAHDEEAIRLQPDFPAARAQLRQMQDRR